MSPGSLLVDIAAAAIKRIRNRPKAVARRAAKAARNAKRERQPDEAAGEFFQPDEETTMGPLLLEILGSFARTGLPWATAMLDPLGIHVTGDNPTLTIALAVGVYAFMQIWSIVRKLKRNNEQSK